MSKRPVLLSTRAVVLGGLLSAIGAGPLHGAAGFEPRTQDAVAPRRYFPPRGEWQRRTPAEVGMDAEGLQRAVDFAIEHEADTEQDLAEYIARTLANEPHGAVVGPTRSRGAMNGVVVRRGYLVAEWGPTEKVDMTFSVTKSYLSATVGLAFDAGLIPDPDGPVVDLVPTQHFEGPRHSRITWDHLLRQTSDWRGSLWEKYDWADRPPRGASLEEMQDQPLHEPGTHYEYNDVRVNLLALAAMEVWRQPLPVVLRERIMDPIGASRSWRWHGYETSWMVLDGQRMQSVSGGGHWGGGMFISTLDHARFGLLFLRGGVWKGRRILSEEWIRRSRTPGPANPGYGYMNWFLNHPRPGGDLSRRPLPSAPIDSVTFRGAGSNIVYIDVENDLVVVLRWMGDGLDTFLGQVLGAIED